VTGATWREARAAEGRRRIESAICLAVPVRSSPVPATSVPLRSSDSMPSLETWKRPGADVVSPLVVNETTVGP